MIQIKEIVLKAGSITGSIEGSINKWLQENEDKIKFIDIKFSNGNAYIVYHPISEVSAPKIKRVN